MNIRAHASAVCFSICFTTAGMAANFTVKGTGYNVSTITGAFDVNSALLMDQLFGNDTELASPLVPVSALWHPPIGA